MTYSCPICHLRFHYASELDDHAREAHVPLALEELREHLTAYRDERPRVRFVTPSM